MNVYLNKITGIDDAIESMFMSKRTWTKDLALEVKSICDAVFVKKTSSISDNNYIETGAYTLDEKEKADKWLNTLVRIGTKHTTLLRYIDISVTVEGLHRGGQDDWDSHAMRFNNRIVRSSTRLASFGYEMSDFYKDKIISTDEAMKYIGILVPRRFTKDGIQYVKTINGYVDEKYKDNKDVLRGLYMLSIPSNFIFKINLVDWCHVYKQRNATGTAHPEVKELCEKIADAIEKEVPQFNKELFENIVI